MTYGFNRQDANKILRLIDKGMPQGGPPGFYREPSTRYLFQNVAGETAPARACMRVTDVIDIGNTVGFEIDKPDGTHGLFVFNGPADVADDGFGTCYGGPIVTALYDTGTPANGDVYGVDGWELSTSGTNEVAVTVYGIADATDKFLLGNVQGSNVGVFLCTASADFTTASSSFSGSISSLLVGNGPNSGTITIGNTGGIFEGTSGDDCIVVGSAGSYYLIQKECAS